MSYHPAVIIVGVPAHLVCVRKANNTIAFVNPHGVAWSRFAEITPANDRKKESKK